MKLDPLTKAELLTLSYAQVKAMEKLKDTLLLAWATTSFKKDTEFDTLWNVAGYEAKHSALIEFMKLIHNPEQQK